MYLKQHHLQFSGGKGTLVARRLRHVPTGQQSLELERNDTTSDSEVNTVIQEKTQTTQKTMHSQTLSTNTLLSITIDVHVFSLFNILESLGECCKDLS